MKTRIQDHLKLVLLGESTKSRQVQHAWREVITSNGMIHIIERRMNKKKVERNSIYEE